jgi:uncharacterized protein with von Willebrand factor type A (vWA) domain
MFRYIYSKWDGSQPFDLDTEKLMNELGKQLFRHGNLSQALRALQRSAFKGQNRQMPSLERLAERLSRMKQDQLSQYNLDSVMDEIKQKLDKILDTERQGIQKKLDEARKRTKVGTVRRSGNPAEVTQARRRYGSPKSEAQRTAPDVGGRIKELSHYDFMDEDA